MPNSLRRAGKNGLGVGMVAVQLLGDAQDAFQVLVRSSVSLPHGSAYQIFDQNHFLFVRAVGRPAGVEIERDRGTFGGFNLGKFAKLFACNHGLSAKNEIRQFWSVAESWL